MSTDRDKFLLGLKFLAVGFPFLFMGPVLLTWMGVPAWRLGHYSWMIISILLMITAVFFCVKGLRTVLSAFFDKKS